MPTKRVPLNRSAHARITPEIIALWRRILEIQDSGADEEWEEAGGRRRELLDADRDLCSALGLSPWHTSPADVPSQGPPEPWEDPGRFALAQELRRALEAAAAKP
jgi:hypothetical protein